LLKYVNITDLNYRASARGIHARCRSGSVYLKRSPAVPPGWRGKAIHGDLERIARLIEALRAQGRVVRMLDIDPISAYLGRSDSYKNAEMRMLLTPLAEWAERMQIGVLVVTHLNKNGGSTNALGRITDSLAIAALSRTAWLTAVEKDDEDKETGRGLFMRGKNNISPRDISNLAYRIESVTVRLDDGGLSSQPKIMWDTCVATTAEEVLAPSYGKASKLDKAEDFLRYTLANGPVEVTKINELRKVSTRGERSGEQKRGLALSLKSRASVLTVK
jgi:putative DNA primase/helicase